MSHQSSENEIVLENVSRDLELGADLLELRTAQLLSETARFLTELFIKRADEQPPIDPYLQRDWNF